MSGKLTTVLSIFPLIPSFISHQIKQNEAVKGLSSVLQDLPNYPPNARQPGDIFFDISEDSLGHTNITGSDVTNKIESVDPYGVRVFPMAKYGDKGVVFRFDDKKVALNAAKLAESWANTWLKESKEYLNDGVGYADVKTGFLLTSRGVSTLGGSCNFGKGAKARLLKYQKRNGMRPKNVVCSELAILAYQLCMTEKDDGFIELDAKHSTPTSLYSWLILSKYWTPVAHKKPNDG